ncbi:putative metal-nicotianamine transporter YSL6-like protein [Haematococcus lacustris]
MERLPFNPDELAAEEHAAASALREAGSAQHQRHHADWLARHRSASPPLPSAPTWRAAGQLGGGGSEGGELVEPLLGGLGGEEEVREDELEEDEDEFQAALARLPPWHAQLSLRGLAVGLLLGALFCVVTHKLNLGAGIIPSLNIAAGLLAFCFLRVWAALAAHCGWPAPPAGAQECNTVQTFITACSSVAFTGGFASFLTALDRVSYTTLGGEAAPGNRAEDVYEPTIGRVLPYLFSVSVIGVFTLISMRKTMIIDYNLTYPSGTATGLMIDSFFTKRGAATAGAQLQHMGRFFLISVVWDAFKWMFSATSCAFCSQAGVSCGGLEALPLFGLAAARWTFYLNAAPNIIGAGMICPHVVNLSMLFGALLTWGWLWPLIATKEGQWYPAGLDEHNFSGLFGYKVFITIALLMGDGLYNLIKPRSREGRPPLRACCGCCSPPSAPPHAPGLAAAGQERRLRRHVFLSDTLPPLLGLAGYCGFGVLGTLVIPHLYPAVRWYYVAIGFVVSPLMALPVSFGAGLTDWDVSSMMAKLAIFGFAGWAGLQAGGVVVGLAMSGVVLAVTSTNATLMQDYRTGFITKSAPKAMFTAQLAGALAGAVLAPLTFAMFWATGKVGDPHGPYPTPYSAIYRAMAIFGTQGLAVLPQHCAALMALFFTAALLVNLARDLLPHRLARFIPIPMAMSIPFVLGAYIAINMSLGSLILFVWECLDPAAAELLAPAVASGIIVGDGVFSVPVSVLGMLGIGAPMCMAFSSRQIGRS